MELWMWAALGAIVAAIAATLVIFTMRWRDRRKRGEDGATVSEANTTRRLRRGSPSRRGVARRPALDLRRAGSPLTRAIGPRGAHRSVAAVAVPIRHSPARAVREAEHLVVTVMEEQDYASTDAEVRADALSVEMPDLAADYRAAHRAFETWEGGDATTDQLLGAFLIYRELLEFLLDRPQREETVFDAEPPPRDDAPVLVGGHDREETSG